MKFFIITAMCFFFIKPTSSKEPNPLLQYKLNYKLDLNSLFEGHFQYFFGILKNTNKGFVKLNSEISHEDTSKIIQTFFPLDIYNDWVDEEDNYLVVAKFNYLLPIGIDNITPSNINNTNYLQQTMPKYKVIKEKKFYYVSGSLFTPDFNLKIDFLNKDSKLLKKFYPLDLQKLESDKIKIQFQYQDNFGKVMMFNTAKMASALTIYEYFEQKNTLVTQYIFSNIINIPAKSLVKRNMLKNMQDVVSGSRKAVQNFSIN